MIPRRKPMGKTESGPTADCTTTTTLSFEEFYNAVLPMLYAEDVGGPGHAPT